MSWNENMGNRDKPDWENRLQEKLREMKNNSKAYFTQRWQEISYKKLFGSVLIGLMLVWLMSGIYIVDQGTRGVVTRFHAYADTTMPGPHWHWPAPIEKVDIVNVEKQRYIEIGYRSGNSIANNASVIPEALMLTKDENIVSINLAVQYQINNAKNYLFNVINNELTLKQVTESVLRGVMGRNDMDYILTEGRTQIVSEIKENIQQAIDDYQTGLLISSVNLQDAQPPEEVQNAFQDAIRAREDKQRLINEAQAYANEIIPKARGKAARMIQEAEAYEAQEVEKAKGETERFEQLLVEFEKAPEITRKRLFLQAKAKLYGSTNKVLLNVESGNNMFYMPLQAMAQSANTTQQLSPSPQYSADAAKHEKSYYGRKKANKTPQYRPSRSK